MKCPVELWKVNWRVEGMLGGLEVRESWKKILREAKVHKGL
jgi:hypothetical protein